MVIVVNKIDLISQHHLHEEHDDNADDSNEDNHSHGDHHSTTEASSWEGYFAPYNNSTKCDENISHQSENRVNANGARKNERRRSIGGVGSVGPVKPLTELRDIWKQRLPNAAGKIILLFF